MRIERDRDPPEIEATVTSGTVRWKARDAGTPWLGLKLVARRGGAVVERRVERAPFQGSRPLALDERERWHLTLVAVDSSGNRTVRTLGHFGLDARYPE